MVDTAGPRISRIAWPKVSSALRIDSSSAARSSGGSGSDWYHSSSPRCTFESAAPSSGRWLMKSRVWLAMGGTAKAISAQTSATTPT